MRARLAAYAGYQIRDYFAGRAIASILVTAAVVWVYVRALGLTPAVLDPAAGIEARAQLQAAFGFTLASFAFIAAAVGAQGLVARDRSRGYDRVLFSRPVLPARFYLQGFLVGGIGAIVLAAIGAELYGAMLHPVSVTGVVGFVALSWVTVGGVGFLLSTMTRWHTVLLAVVIGADLALDRYAAPLRTAVGALVDVVQFILPPAHAVVALRDEFVRGAVVTPAFVMWAGGYGLASLIIAAILLVRRPFSR